MQGSSPRWGWLKFMYLYTIVGAGSLGLGIIIAPDVARAALGWPKQDPITYGVAGSVYLAFGALSILGLRSPVRFAPVLLQLCYKLIWLVGVMLPLAARGDLPAQGIVLAAIFATYIIGDAIAIPFGYVLERETRSA